MTQTRQDFGNREGLHDFDIQWHDAEPGKGSFTAVLRVRNESASLPYVLPPLLRCVEHVVLIDNGSDDGTPDVARQSAKEGDAEDRLTVLDYPFSVGRCGPEHLSIPHDSVHSLTYYYNWAFSQVRTRYGLKWDGDMVLTEDGERYFRHLSWELEGIDAIVQIPRYAVYVESADVAYLDVGMTNREPWAWPNKPEYFHGKAFEWELPLWPESLPFVRLPEWTVFELKWLDADEFAHWSDGTDFNAANRTGRKAREWSVFHAVQSGNLPADVHRVESPGDAHVIDLLRSPSFTDLVWQP